MGPGGWCATRARRWSAERVSLARPSSNRSRLGPGLSSPHRCPCGDGASRMRDRLVTSTRDERQTRFPLLPDSRIPDGVRNDAGMGPDLRRVSHPTPIATWEGLVGTSPLHKAMFFPWALFTLLAADYRVGADHGFQWVLSEVEIGIVPPLYAFKLLQYRLSAAWVGLPRGLLSRRTTGRGHRRTADPRADRTT